MKKHLALPVSIHEIIATQQLSIVKQFTNGMSGAIVVHCKTPQNVDVVIKIGTTPQVNARIESDIDAYQELHNSAFHSLYPRILNRYEDGYQTKWYIMPYLPGTPLSELMLTTEIDPTPIIQHVIDTYIDQIKTNGERLKSSEAHQWFTEKTCGIIQTRWKKIKNREEFPFLNSDNSPINYFSEKTNPNFITWQEILSPTHLASMPTDPLPANIIVGDDRPSNVSIRVR